MDWGSDMSSNMWVLPRGMKRDGMGGKDSIQWESKYGSVIVSGYDISTAEGINEKGLVANLLALVESSYGTPPAGKKVICISTWAQYVLDNFATVAEAVADLEKEEFQVQTTVMPTKKEPIPRLTTMSRAPLTMLIERVVEPRRGIIAVTTSVASSAGR